MAKKSVDNQNKTLLLELLSQWSIKHNLSEDPYLNAMKKTIENGLPLGVLNELDVEKHLPRPKSLKGSKLIKTAKNLAILRNILVFVPVAITWKAISEATKAFARFVSSQNVAPVNFLEFWQNGYGELYSFWKIGNVADVDYLLILTIITSTLLSTLLLNLGKNLDYKTQLLYDQEREIVIFEIKNVLFSPSTTTPEAIDKTLKKSLQDLSAAANAISVAASKLEKSMLKQNKDLEENQKIAREVKSFQSKIIKAIKSSDV